MSAPPPDATRSVTGPSEAGFSLVELLVTMVVLLIVLGIVFRSFTALYASESRQTSISTSQSQLSLAFVALDHELHYASGILQPYSNNGAYFVNFIYDQPGNTSECAQLRYSPSTGVLSQSSWSVPATGAPPAPGPWRVLASSLATASQPFALVHNVGADTSGAYTDKQQLQIDLAAVAGGGSGQESSDSTSVFTAVNSTSADPSSSNQPANTCQGVSSS